MLDIPRIECAEPLPRGAVLVGSTDRAGRFLHCNDALLQACGYRREELLGRSFTLLCRAGMPIEVRLDMCRRLAAGEAWTAVVMCGGRPGHGFWARLAVAPLAEAGGRIGFGFIGSRPLRSELWAAEDLQAAMRTGAASWRDASRDHDANAIGRISPWRLSPTPEAP